MRVFRWLVLAGLAALLGSGTTFAADQDGDGVEDESDNCPAIHNPAQDDSDSDGVGGRRDSCPQDPNPYQFPRRISHEPLHNWTSFAAIRFTHDETRVVYCSDRQSNTNDELFVTPWDASDPPIDLSELEQYREVRSSLVSADDAWVVYSADREVSDEFHLYSVPLAGGSSTRLDVAPIVRPSGGWYLFSTDGSEVFFEAEHPSVSGVRQVFRVPVAGGPPTMIDTWTTIGLSCERFALAAGGSRLLIFGDDGGSLDRLGSVLLSDESSVLLGEASTLRYLLTADGNQVILQRTDLDDRLEHVPADGSASPVLLNVPDEDVLGFAVTPQPVDGDYRAVWTAQSKGIFSNRLDGTDRRTVSSLIPLITTYGFPPDGSEVVFRKGGIFAASVLGGGERTLSNLGAEELRVAPDGSRVFFIDGNYDVYPEQYRLWSVPFDGSEPELRHDETLPSSTGVEWWLPSPTSDGVFYSATRADGESLRIYWSPAALPGWVELSEQGRARFDFAVASDGRRIAYADSEWEVVITPMRLWARALDPDRDQDDLAEACDCNDYDTSQLPPAIAVDSLRLAKDDGGTRLLWDAPEEIGLGDQYTVLRADAPDAYAVGGTIDCLAGPSGELKAFDTGVPTTGATFSYLVRVDNGCGAGPLSSDRPAGESHVCP